ncbi:hypothetical protein BJX61DRAFT_541013 [Aspergillus egyptiacus]|nr:hypothetical protein BJX61DRAFT_541013 [Aspergillus egyptiacus]
MRRINLGFKDQPVFGCVICGADLDRDYDNNPIEERADWEDLISRRRRSKNPARSIIVPAAEVEEMDFVARSGWQHFFRAILEEPETDRVFLSGIEYSMRPYICRVPILIDPNKARLMGYVKYQNHWNADYYMANLFGWDRHKAEGRRVGYPVHAHCWLLACRLIGVETVPENLQEFIQAVKGFWKGKKKNWNIFPAHDPGEAACFDQGVFGYRENAIRTVDFEEDEKEEEEEGDEEESDAEDIDEEDEEDEESEAEEDVDEDVDVDVDEEDEEREAEEEEEDVGEEEESEAEENVREDEVYHQPGSPFRIPAIQELMRRVTSERSSRPRPHPAVHVPVEIALMIVDLIYKSRPLCQERVDDTRNLMEAFHWDVPDTYWISRCDPKLIFEVDDLVASGKRVDWAGFCLGLEELMVDPHWFCNSGLEYRRRIIRTLDGIKERFVVLLKKKNSRQ